MWQILMTSLRVLCLLGLWYLALRLHRFSAFRRLGEGHPVLAWALAALAVAPLGLFYLRFNETTLSLVVIHLVLGFWLTDLACKLLQKLRKKPALAYDTRGLIALGLSLVYLGAGWFQAHHVFETDYRLESEKLTAPLRVVAVADSHLGITLDGAGFAAHMERIEALKPDLLVMVGDFVDDDTDRADMLEACAALGAVETRYGVYFIYGNHDNGYFNYRNFSGQELRRSLEEAGVIILDDEGVPIGDDCWLLGRLDRSMRGRKDMAALTADLDRERYSLVLDHQPNDYAAQAEAGVDLVISGHTHGGHIFPAGIIGLLSGSNDQCWGLERRENTDFIVTSGLSGWAIPFKTGTYSELVVIDLAPKAE